MCLSRKVERGEWSAVEKQTKNIITREWVEKELRFYNTADIKAMLVLCGALSLVLIPFTVGFVYAICVFVPNVALKIILSVLIGALSTAPVWINLLGLRGALSERKLLRRGEFDIAVRTVTRKSEKPVYRHVEEFLHFDDFEEISFGHTKFQLASHGDEFYIVHYKTRKTIKLLYSAKMYEYE